MSRNWERRGLSFELIVAYRRATHGLERYSPCQPQPVQSRRFRKANWAAGHSMYGSPTLGYIALLGYVVQRTQRLIQN